MACSSIAEAKHRAFPTSDLAQSTEACAQVLVPVCGAASVSELNAFAACADAGCPTNCISVAPDAGPTDECFSSLKQQVATIAQDGGFGSTCPSG